MTKRDTRVPMRAAAVLLGILAAAAPRPGVAAEPDQPLTDAAVVSFLKEMEEVFQSQDAEKIIAFVDARYRDDAAIEMTVKIEMEGQAEPVTQQNSLTKQQQIEQLRQAAPLYAAAKDHAYTLKVKDIRIVQGGASASTDYETKETATFEARAADGSPITLRHQTIGRCATEIVAGESMPTVSRSNCSYQTSANQI